MTFKDILVHIDGTERSDVRLGIAGELASRNQAHLTGLYVVELPPPALFYGDPSGYADVQLIDEIMTKMRNSAMEAARPAEQAFRERLRREGIEGEWRLVEGPLADTIALHIRYADIGIVGQTDPKAPLMSGIGQIPATTLLSTGRPVLMIPYAGSFTAVGKTVLVGWKSSREAARAVNDALPILRQAKSVTILAINPQLGIGGDGDVPAADIALHLARHGVKASAAHTVADEISEGDALLNHASEIDADLIVSGGYGHSRAREFIFGGVTRSLLSTMTVPVLLSH